jgi:hypothetical protein
MTRAELIFRIRGSGCKMLDAKEVQESSKEQLICLLKKSCCKVYERLVKEFGEEYVCGSINERTCS